MLTLPDKNSSPLPLKTPVIGHVTGRLPRVCRQHRMKGLLLAHPWQQNAPNPAKELVNQRGTAVLMAQDAIRPRQA